MQVAREPVPVSAPPPDPEEQMREIWQQAADPQAMEVPVVKQTQELPAVRTGRGARVDPGIKRDIAERFRAAEDGAAFAKSVGVHVTTLRAWAREALGPGKPGRKVIDAKPDAKPKRAAGAGPPPPPSDLDPELEVLRQLLALPAAARNRIVAYLTARDR